MTDEDSSTASQACPESVVLSAFMARALAEPERRRVEMHCNACQRCRATLSHAVIAFAASTDVAPSPHDVEARAFVPRGTALGRYLVLEELGRGAMGVVYSAYDPELDRRIALKVLHSRLGHEPSDRESWRTRLVREARALAAITHPNVIAIHDVGAWGDDVFIAMALVDGGTLSAWLRERQRAPQEIIAVFVAAGRGLAAAHRHGLVHRDFKPDNVLVSHDGAVRVSDFGLARFIAGERVITELDPRSPFEVDACVGPTRTGGLIGTPAYMSPEQLQGRSAEPRSDQYSFCVALHEALFGRRPFAADTTRALLEAQGGAPQFGETGVRVPARLRRVLARGLSFEPEQRFENMDALLAALTPPRMRRWAAPVFLAVGIAGGGIGTSLLPAERDPCVTTSASELWNEELATRIEASIGRSSTALASDRSTRVAEHLRRRAEAFERTEQQVCRAANETGAMCLEGWRLDFEALTKRLVDADRSVAEAAEGLVYDVPDPATCTDERWMPPLPSDAQMKARASKSWLMLAAARRDLIEGNLGDAKTKLDAQRSESEAVRHPPLQAEAQGLACELAQLEERLQEARELCPAAATAALRAGHIRAFEDAAVATSAVLASLEEYSRSLDWLDLAEATREELGLERVSSDLVNQRAWLLGLQGHYAEAVATIRDALPQLPEHDISGQIMLQSNLSQWLWRLDEQDAAERAARWAVDAAVRLYGETNTVTQQTRLALTSVLPDSDPQVLVVLEELVAGQIAHHGPDHPMLVSALHNLAVAALQQGQLEQALEANERSYTLSLQKFPEADLRIAQQMLLRAKILAALGREAEAQTMWSDGLDRIGPVVERAAPELVPLLLETALFYSSRGRHADAAAWLREVEPIARRHHPEVMGIIAVLLEDARAGHEGVSLARLSADETVDQAIAAELIAAHEHFMQSAPKRR